MKHPSLTGLAAAVVLCTSVAYAAGPECALGVGDGLPAFNVVKYSGAVDDGVAVGSELCYR